MALESIFLRESVGADYREDPKPLIKKKLLQWVKSEAHPDLLQESLHLLGAHYGYSKDDLDSLLSDRDSEIK